MISNITAGDDFSGLTSYLIDHRDHQILLLRGVSSIDSAPREMEVVASTSARVRKPAMHLSFSAAVEDGVLPDSLWLELVDEADREFDLADHQLVAVRHRDKNYDHIHVFWCTVNPETGQCPPKQVFRARGAPKSELDQRALSAEIAAQLPTDAVTRGAFNRFALSRLMTICREFEVTHNLRQLRDRKSAAAARASGGPRPPRPADQHREQRTGRPPVTAARDVIRRALDQPNYTSMRSALNRAGFDFEPVTRVRANGGLEFRGLTIIDMVDAGNRAPASAFDSPDRRYGLRQIEKRHERGAATIETWWPTREEHSAGETSIQTDTNEVFLAYQRLRDQHRREEGKRSDLRRRLAKRHAHEQRVLRAKLMRLRRLRAERLSPADRRAFYSHFTRTTRAKIWTRMEQRQAGERTALRRRALRSWKQFQSEQSAAGSVPTRRTTVTALPAGSFISVGGKQSPAPARDNVPNVEGGADLGIEADWANVERFQKERDGR